MAKGEKKENLALKILLAVGLSVTALLVLFLILSYTSALDTFLVERAVGTYKFDSMHTEEDGVRKTINKGENYFLGYYAIELTEDYATLELNKDGTFQFNASLFGGTEGTFFTGTWTRHIDKIILSCTNGEEKIYTTNKSRIILVEDGIELVLIKQGI